jgi:hypothetical protein
MYGILSCTILLFLSFFIILPSRPSLAQSFPNEFLFSSLTCGRNLSAKHGNFFVQVHGQSFKYYYSLDESPKLCSLSEIYFPKSFIAQKDNNSLKGSSFLEKIF